MRATREIRQDDMPLVELFSKVDRSRALSDHEPYRFSARELAQAVARSHHLDPEVLSAARLGGNLMEPLQFLARLLIR